MTRRHFLSNAIIGSFGLGAGLLYSPSSQASMMTSHSNALPQISLAQWSLNKMLFAGDLPALDFPAKAMDWFQISAVEYVNQFYSAHGTDEKYWQHLKEQCDQAGVKSLLIMVDDEGDLGDPQHAPRKAAVENHYKWVHAAKILGCHAIRVNAFGEGSEAQVLGALREGMDALATYSAQEGIHVLIENHGLLSSNARSIVQLIEDVNNPYLGTLPDFGNWCLSEKWGSTRLDNCSEVYDHYEGVSTFLPYAKGVSAKSYDFSDDGNQQIIDYPRMLKIIKDFGYEGYIGIEYEGENLSEVDGIKATKKLIDQIWSRL